MIINDFHLALQQSFHSFRENYPPFISKTFWIMIITQTKWV